MSFLILSLTTIPSRAKYLGHLLNSLERQSLQPDRIELNLPNVYKKRDFGEVDRRQIPSDFTVFECEDFGPATKILPTLMRYKQDDAQIIYCDDDRLFHMDWAKRLTETAAQHPNCAIADECNAIADIEYLYANPVKTLSYRAKRAASLGFYNPYRSNRRQNWDVVEGFGGVLVRPSFFSDTVFDVPDNVWAVDDIWLSANLVAKGTGIRWTGRKHSQRSKSLRVEGENLGRTADALVMSTFDGMNRAKADYFAVKRCRDMMGVWSQS